MVDLKEAEPITLKFGWGMIDGPKPGVPVVAVYRKNGEFVIQFYLDDEDIAKAKDWAIRLVKGTGHG